MFKQMKKSLMAAALALSTAGSIAGSISSAWANCDAAQGAVDLDRCPFERVAIERDARIARYGDQLCRSIDECASLGGQAFRAGDWRLATHYFEQQASHAEEHRSLNDALVAYHNAAIAHLRGRNCMDAREWLDTVALLDPDGNQFDWSDQDRTEQLYRSTCGPS